MDNAGFCVMSVRGDVAAPNDAAQHDRFWMLIRFAAALAAAFLPMPLAASAQTLDPQNTIYMDLPAGRVVIKLRPDLAPNHVARIKELTREGFYDGTPFHRVIPGFMAQGGDPTGTGSGDSNCPTSRRSSRRPVHPRHDRHGAHRRPNSANSQFFVVFGDTPG